MWEAIAQVFTSGNGVTIAVLITAILFMGVLLVKHGVLRISTKTVHIGADERERTIIRHQVEWIRNSVNGFEAMIPKPEGYDKYRGRFVLERVFDEMLNWIVFNHIEDTHSYIHIKQTNVWNIVMTFTDKKEHHSQKFHDMVFEQVEVAIKSLIMIRKEYR